MLLLEASLPGTRGCTPASACRLSVVVSYRAVLGSLLVMSSSDMDGLHKPDMPPSSVDPGLQ
jgi:hypothetical protein